MATRIRLKRLGGRHDPHYRIVVADARKQRDGRAIEELGYYSPAGSSAALEINAERARHWLERGAQPSETVRSLLRRAGVTEAVPPLAAKHSGASETTKEEAATSEQA
ncbi:MAG: 30S ribosomal protein S16 [Armatimonadota bacterium]